MDADTTDPSYWLNWRFFISALYVLGTLTSALYIIQKYEWKKRLDEETRDSQQVPVGVLYKDELWKTCHKAIHPFWLLLFRVIAFGVLLGFIIGNTIVDGPYIFYYYTQWTFVLTTIYFGLACAFSLYGFCHEHDVASHSKAVFLNVDTEQGSNGVQKIGGGRGTPLLKNWSNYQEGHVREVAGFMAYLVQILYQVAGGSVLLTDVVYWLFLYPVKSTAYSKVAFFDKCMHSVNILILGDALLNNMRFPVFRIAYFIEWTGVFVIFQWIFHVFISKPWPYPFMDLSTPYAPLWYLAVGVMHLPCYGCFALIVKLEHMCYSRSSSDAYADLR